MADRTVILGTDWWTDCDDVAAVRITCRADKAGLWKFAGYGDRVAAGEEAGYSLRKGYAKADPETGENSFIYDENGPHAYVVREKEVAWYEEKIAEWIKN